MAAITETVLGVFAHVDTTVRALEELRAKGYHDLTVYTPVPIHEIEDVLERDRPVSRVRIFALFGGLVGLISAWLLTQWTSMQWDLVVGEASDRAAGEPALHHHHVRDDGALRRHCHR